MKKILTGLGMLLALLSLPLAAEGEVNPALPPELRVIEAEAFANVPMEHLVIPEGVVRIGERAFAGTGLQRITLPSSLSSIAPDAFSGCGQLWARVPQGSYAAQWCADNGVSVYTVTGLGVASHTEQEIRSFAESHPASTGRRITYRQEPQGGSASAEAYAPGLISEESLADGLNMLNQVRYIAGLNADVTIDAEYERMTGAASLVHALNDMISHYPPRPDEIGDSAYDALYDLACAGSGRSNLFAGAANLAYAVLGYMEDSDAYNLPMVGHRRWILNPSMGKTAFGYHYRADSTWQHFSSLYAFDMSGAGNQTLVAWPAQKTPMSHFLMPASCAWSLSFGRYLDPDAIEVVLRRTRDGRTWNFSTAAADGAFYVNNTGYGQSGCVIFRPDEMDGIAAGDSFEVSVTDHGSRTVVEYTVEFFNL